jgi:putative ABC transport system ATP-binding protein
LTDSTGEAWCEDLTKTYPSAFAEVRALRGVTARFPASALTTVTGPSGSGKSTLLRLLAGLDRPTSGQLEVDGLAVHRASARARLRLRKHRVGYLFQRPSDNLLPYLTIGEHLRLASRSTPPPEVRAALLSRLEIGHRVEHRPSELSGGEQYRAALASLLCSRPRIVLADEPTAALDTASARQLTDLLRSATATGVTVVVASHDPTLRDEADHVVELSHGRVVGTPADDRREARLARAPAPGGQRAPDGRSSFPAGRVAGAAILEVRGVKKAFRTGPVEVRAVREATLSVRSGEVVGLVGRSGSGKTTLLNLIAGWEAPDGGVILRPGAGLEAPPWSEVAVVPQKLGLLDELTIRQNVEYPARLAGLLDELRDVVAGLIEELALSQLQDRHPRETSVGEQQRCAIARALVLHPALLLADEPVGHQDVHGATATFEALTRVADRGTGILVATHGEAAMRFLDRVLPIVDGYVEATE